MKEKEDIKQAAIIRSIKPLKKIDLNREQTIKLLRKTKRKGIGSLIKYLEERDYDYIVAGEDHIDLKKALEILNEKYGAKRVMTDTGGTLSSLLLEQGLVDEISLLVHPLLLGNKSTNIFRTLKQNIKLELIKSEVFEKNYILLFCFC